MSLDYIGIIGKCRHFIHQGESLLMPFEEYNHTQCYRDDLEAALNILYSQKNTDDPALGLHLFEMNSVAHL